MITLSRMAKNYVQNDFDARSVQRLNHFSKLVKRAQWILLGTWDEHMPVTVGTVRYGIDRNRPWGAAIIVPVKQ